MRYHTGSLQAGDDGGGDVGRIHLRLRRRHRRQVEWTTLANRSHLLGELLKLTSKKDVLVTHALCGDVPKRGKRLLRMRWCRTARIAWRHRLAVAATRIATIAARRFVRVATTVRRRWRRVAVRLWRRRSAETMTTSASTCAFELLVRIEIEDAALADPSTIGEHEPQLIARRHLRSAARANVELVDDAIHEHLSRLVAKDRVAIDLRLQLAWLVHADAAHDPHLDTHLAGVTLPGRQLLEHRRPHLLGVLGPLARLRCARRSGVALALPAGLWRLGRRAMWLHAVDARARRRSRRREIDFLLLGGLRLLLLFLLFFTLLDLIEIFRRSCRETIIDGKRRRLLSTRHVASLLVPEVLRARKEASADQATTGAAAMTGLPHACMSAPVRRLKKGCACS